jgi:transcriptional regulator with XRE-family HTH domain
MEEEASMALGARLKDLRLKKGKSLQQVADHVGVSKAHIWDLETGKSSNPSMELLTGLASYFETSVSALVGEDPHESEDPELIAMFRDLKLLGDTDRKTIHAVMKTLKDTKEKKGGKK